MTIGVVIAQIMGSVAMLLIGYLLGRMYTRGVKPKPTSPPKPICMCGHHYGSHMDGRNCKFVLRDGWGARLGGCSCTLYVGPDPVLSGLWHPPVKNKP